MISLNELKVNDIFRFSYNADEGIIHGFAKVVSIENFDISCTDIFIDSGEIVEGLWILKEGRGYEIIEILTNRKSDLETIKESYPEYFI